MSPIRINMAGAKKKLAQTSAAVRAGEQNGPTEIADKLAQAIAADAPVDTGALRDSVQASGNTVTVGVGAVDYASFVDKSQPFIDHNVDAIKAEAAKIVDDEVRRNLP